MLYPDSRSGYFDIRKLQSQPLLSGKRKCKNLSKVFTVFQKAERPLRSEILGLFFSLSLCNKKEQIFWLWVGRYNTKKNSTISNLTQIYITRTIQTRLTT